MGALPSRYWQDLTSDDFAKLDPERVVAVLPVAAVEQHGPHLPVWTDACICQAVVERSLTRLPDDLPILVLPMMPVGLSVEHGDFPGTLTLSVETILALWTEIGASVAAAGLRKLALVNSHGGQPQILDLVAQRLRMRHGMMVFKANAYRSFRDPALFSGAEIAHGIHGGAIETSIMLHLRPDLVHRDAAVVFTPSSVEMAESYDMIGPFGEVGFAWQSQDLHPSGACGDASAADADKGAALLDRAANWLTKALAEMVRAPLITLRDLEPN